jgi:hypothetical protein
MSENHIQGKEPLWLLIEKELQNYQTVDFSEDNSLITAKKIATTLDQTGYNVSKMAGNWLQLKAAIEMCHSVGRPFIKDFNQAIDALTLDNLDDTNATAWSIISGLRNDWPFIVESETVSDVKDIVRKKRVDLVIAKALDLGGEQGVRFLIAEEFNSENIIEIMGISEDEYKAVQAKVDAELAEIQRTKDLLTAMADASEQDKIKHLFSENVAENLILEIGGFDQAALDTVKKIMEEELAEKKRQEEELAAKKAAEAAGPSLDEISADKMLEYIEGIREILDFADSEKEIRVMCEQSSIPKALVEIAVNEPDKLDELEQQAEG